MSLPPGPMGEGLGSGWRPNFTHLEVDIEVLGRDQSCERENYHSPCLPEAPGRARRSPLCARKDCNAPHLPAKNAVSVVVCFQACQNTFLRVFKGKPLVHFLGSREVQGGGALCLRPAQRKILVFFYPRRPFSSPKMCMLWIGTEGRRLRASWGENTHIYA